jgi:hypothetical protein
MHAVGTEGKMPEPVKSLVLSFVTGAGGIALVLSMIISFLFTVWARRLRAVDWILAVAVNIPIVIYLGGAVGGLDREILAALAVLVLAFGAGGFGVGWVLGLLLCLLFWQFQEKKVDAPVP